MLLSINPYNPQERLIEKAVDILKNDGVIIYPTDSSYSFGCSIQSKKAMKRIYQLKQIEKKQPLTFICNNAQQFQQYTRGIPNNIFRILKAKMPGPYTFIFEASKLVPKTMLSPRSTIGVRVPDSDISRMLVEKLGEPILSSSVPLAKGESFQDPYLISEQFMKQIDCLIDADEVYVTQSAIIDFSADQPEIIRDGDADISWLNLS